MATRNRNLEAFEKAFEACLNTPQMRVALELSRTRAFFDAMWEQPGISGPGVKMIAQLLDHVSLQGQNAPDFIKNTAYRFFMSGYYLGANRRQE